MSDATILPKRWVQLTNLLEKEEWNLARISGSHHIFTKPGRRCIPVAFHGGTVSPRYASLILKQAGLSEDLQPESSCIDEITHGIRFIDTENSIEAMVKEEGKGIKHRKSREGKAIRVTMAESVESIRRDKEMEHSREVLAQMDMERGAHRQRLELERNQIIETIQGLVAKNNYKDVVEMTSSVNIRDCGSSSEMYEFNCNILFYRTMALGEYALLSLKFNSTEQKDMISEALDFATIALQVSPEQRAGVREFTSNLQQRVVSRYADGLQREFILYREKHLNFDDYDESATYNTCKIAQGEREATKKELYTMMDQIVRGFEFVVLITDVRSITLDEVLGDYVIYQIQDIPLIGPLQVYIRKMLISFDFGEYDLVLHLSKTLSVFAKSFPVTLGLYEAFARDSSFTPQLLNALILHVKDLAPMYEFCYKKLQWNRCASLVVDDPMEVQRMLNDDEFEDMMFFINMFISVFERSEAHLKYLAVSRVARTFFMDSFMDPITMANGMLDKAMFDENTDTSRRVRPLLKKLTRDKRSLDDLLMESSATIAIFRKSKYDLSRVRLLKLAMSLLRVVQLFDNAFAMSPTKPDRRLKFRYVLLPQVLQKCLILMRIMFGFFELNTTLILQQLVIMQMDHDAADNFSLKLNGRNVIREHLPAHINTPDKAKSYGLWSFSRIFNTFTPAFLIKYVIGKDKQKLLIIHALADDQMKLSHLVPSIEALAFDTIKMVTKFGGRYDKSITSTILEGIIHDEKNHDWCDTFTNDNQIQRWAKQKGQKYSKLITSLSGVIFPSEIQSCMTDWQQSVDFLLGKLHMSTTKYRSVPPDLRAQIKKKKDPIKLVKACKFLPRWCRKDLAEIRKHIIQLLEVSENVTSVLHRATGQMYPVAKSLFNEKWGMSEAIRMQKGEFGSKETLAVIKDIKYVNAILKEYERLQNCSQ